MTDVRLTDCRFDNVARMDVLENVRNVALTNVSINGRIYNEVLTR